LSIRFSIAGLKHPHVEYLIEEVARRSGDVQLIAIADSDSVLRERFSRRLGVTAAYFDYREMLARERLDAVGVVAVYGERAEIIRYCLAAGVHVISDKPLCTRLADLTAIEAEWRKSGCILSVMLEKRFYPPTLAMREILADNGLGELALAWCSGPHQLRRPTRPAWMFQRKSYGGILNDLAVHDVDLLLWLTGARSGHVQGFTGNKGNKDLSEFEDHGQLCLRTDDGLLAAIEVHWLGPEAAPYHGDYRMVLTGTEGTAELRWTHDELVVSTHRVPPRKVDLPRIQYPASDFFAAILAGKEQEILAEEIFIATKVVLLAQATANSGTWQRW
jgi:predicted dehydrogenase